MYKRQIQDVANIYGGIAGAMPGSQTQKFQPTPWVTGLGGGMSAANIMGMFGGANTQAGQVQQPNWSQNYTGFGQSKMGRDPSTLM